MRTYTHSRSSALISGLSLCLIIPLAGCTLHAAKQAATPPPPKPAAVETPAPEPQLSIPQTAVVLPSEQPVNPDAIPPAPATVQPPAPEKTAPPVVIRSRRAASSVPRQEPAEQEAETPPAPPIEEQPPIRPLVSGEEQKRIKSSIESRRRSIEDLLNRAKGHQTDENKALVERINSFLAQSAEAEKRGDFTQADALSVRALILAQELQVE